MGKNHLSRFPGLKLPLTIIEGGQFLNATLGQVYYETIIPPRSVS